MRNILFLSLIIFGISCTKIERLEGVKNTAKKLVVNCFYDFESPMQFEVKHTLSILDNAKIKNISNAKIYIYENNLPFDIINSITGDYYISHFIAKEGKAYSIKVEAPNYTTVTASCPAMYKANVSISDFNYVNKHTATIYYDYCDRIVQTIDYSTNKAENGIVSTQHRILNNQMFVTTYPLNSGSYFTSNLRLRSAGDWTLLDKYGQSSNLFSNNYFNGNVYKTANTNFNSGNNSIKISTEVEDFELFYGDVKQSDLSIAVGLYSVINTEFKLMSPDVMKYFESIMAFQSSNYNGSFLSQPAQIASNIQGGEGIFGYLQVESKDCSIN